MTNGDEHDLGHGRGEPDAVGIAHGRVNLMGDHTDYNGGFVLPASIPQRTRVQLWRRSDDEVRAKSSTVQGDDVFSLGKLQRTHLWTDYVKGVVHVLLREAFSLGGFDMVVDSTVPVGAGLSSSAALQVALLRALRDAFALSLTDRDIARLARAAETDFVGAPVGIMDQMAASVGEPSGVLYLDTRSLVFEVVAIPPSAELVVVDSRVAHSNAGGGYAVRRAESTQAARLLGVECLTDLSLLTDARLIAGLPAPLDRRVRHVLTENARVHATVDALRAGNLQEVRRLFRESHMSLRDDYEVSTPELDALVSAADQDADVFGARMTGGGFGGCVVAIVRAGTGHRSGARLTRSGVAAGFTPAIVLPPQLHPCAPTRAI